MSAVQQWSDTQTAFVWILALFIGGGLLAWLIGRALDAGRQMDLHVQFLEGLHQREQGGDGSDPDPDSDPDEPWDDTARNHGGGPLA